MATLWGSQITRSQLQESIDKLKELDHLPALPSENVSHSIESEPGRLSVTREKEISSNLAFLSAVSDDSLRVMAVCIEEHSDGKGITIRVASNTGDLDVVTRGLVQLAGELEHAARRVRTKEEDIDAAFRKVISLDLYRILSRLRSRHVKSIKTAGKRPLIDQVYNTIHSQLIKATGPIKRARKIANDLRSLFTRLESIQSLEIDTVEAEEIVKQIIKDFCTFCSIIDFARAIRPVMVEPSLKTHLPEAAGKLARYYSAASELVYAARHKSCRLFERVEVRPFQIQKPVSVSRHLKVHAEIQLLFFYEAHPTLPRPRFICSSKKACYMCNLFFLLHGGCQVPRTHGRLYEKWILPDWLEIPVERHQQLGRISTQLKSTIDSNIVHALRRGRRMSYNYPNESDPLPPAQPWSPSGTSTILSHQPSTSTIRPDLPSVLEENAGDVQRTVASSSSQKTPLQHDHVESSDRAIGSASASVVASLLTVEGKDLPYCQVISLSTPSLHLDLGTISLNFDFLRVISGRLFITQVDEKCLSDQMYNAIDIQNIPSASELRIDCSHDSNKLVLRLQTAHRDIVDISFVWEENINLVNET